MWSLGSLTRLLLAIFILFSVALPPANGQTPEPNTTKPALKIATIERKPFAFNTADGVTGFSIELWRAIAVKIGRKTTFQMTKSFPEMLSAVTNGRVDAAIANITINAKRETEMDFSHPIFDSGLRIMIRADGASGGLFHAIFNWEMAGLIGLAGLFLSSRGA